MLSGYHFLPKSMWLFLVDYNLLKHVKNRRTKIKSVIEICAPISLWKANKNKSYTIEIFIIHYSVTSQTEIFIIQFETLTLFLLC